MRYGVRLIALLIGMSSAGVALAQPNVTLTQVDDSGTEVGQAQRAYCGRETCIAAFPVIFADGVCVVTASVSKPNWQGNIFVSFSLEFCYPPLQTDLVTLDYGNPFWAKLGPDNAVTQIADLHLGPMMNGDLVVRRLAYSHIRVDAIFRPERGK